MSILDRLAEQRIAEALRRGDLADLPGAGRPLDLDEAPLVPEARRIANRVLKNAGMLPPELGLRREIALVRAELATLPAGPRRDELRRRLALMLLQWCELGRDA